MIPPAHVLPPLSAPASLDWGVSLGLAVGLCVLFLARPAWRWAGGALSLVACAVGLSLVVVASGASPPDVRLRLVAPVAATELTSPVEVHVCGLTHLGGAASLPGPGRLLAVLVDGRPVATEASPLFALELAPGAHRVEVELVDSGHRAFSPPVTVSVSVRVGPVRGPLAAAGSCPR